MQPQRLKAKLGLSRYTIDDKGVAARTCLKLALWQ